MQAQPRGKKREAKENVTAGGKKTKKEEGEEEPKPLVCAIYRRDIASFLPREKIQQWRQTSSHSNASLIEFPSRLPRFKYQELRVIFVSADRCLVKKDGFLDRHSLNTWMRGNEFNSIFKFRFSCSDVKVCVRYCKGATRRRRLPTRHLDVDPIIKHFEEDVHSVEQAIRNVCYVRDVNEWSDDWPARCPRESATQVTERDDGTVDYRFDYTNEHSGEPFSLVLGIHRHEGRTLIYKFHLRFSSA